MDRKEVTKHEEYDALNGWREENHKYAGGSEYDPTVEAILAYERAKARAAAAKKLEQEDVMGK